MIAMGQATPDAPAMPFIAVETLTMDRGKDFPASRAAAEVLGWSVIDAPPTHRRPSLTSNASSTV